MSLFQSQWALGRKQAPVSRESRGVVVERYEFTVDEDLAKDDIIELGILPAYHFPVDAVLVSDAMGGTVTVDIGIMSGPVGKPDSTRTCGDELFDGASVASAGVVRPTQGKAFTIAPTGADRSIGVKFNDSVTASGQKVILLLFTAQ